MISTISINSSEGSILRWQTEASQAYLYGAYAAHLLNDAEQAFSFMEKNRALLLSESILKNTTFIKLTHKQLIIWMFRLIFLH